MDTMRRTPQPPERRPAPSQEPEPATNPTPEPTRYESSKGSSRRSSKGSTPMKKRILLAVAAVAAVVVLIVGGWYAMRAVNPGLIDTSKYQAVFLSNGQVYFGKLKIDGEYYVLKDIFYLQASDAASTSATSESENPQENAGNDVQLIKLGTEIHGPTDQMVIDKSQVLFFENLKDDGSVVKSIKSYSESNN